MARRLKNYIDGRWVSANARKSEDVINPATMDVLARVPISNQKDVDTATAAAQLAFQDWRRTPTGTRIQYLFELKALLEKNIHDIATTISLEAGKTYGESVGEMRRAIENVEVACGMPMMMQGSINEDIAPGIDEMMIRQPLGVCAAITPFNFPGMIPFWFLPYAIATGNTYIIKPSEKVPLTMEKIIKLIDKLGLPDGVVNMVHGGKDAVNAILDHPDIKAISFVGSTAIAKYVYARAAANGKRCQAQGGAKNPIIILPDADMEMTTKITADSSFGCAGQRCLASSIAIPVGSARDPFMEAITASAESRTTGYGLEDGVQMGSVIDHVSKDRINRLINQGIDEGAKAVVDGRDTVVSGFESGSFVSPTILDNVNPNGEIARTEIFGPVLSIVNAATIDDAIAFINAGNYGNQASLFTSSGAAARKFRYEAEAGNIGINIGVAAPMAFFPFSGWKDSFFGTLHGQGNHAVEFFTQTKVVVERWPKEWSRQF